MKRTAAVLALLAGLAWSVRAQQHPNTAKGFNANSVYQFHQLDAVNQFNGNLTISIPIGSSYPVAAGFSYQLVLHGNANIWDAEEDDTCLQVTPAPVIAYGHRRANAGMGFVLSLGRLFPPEDPTAIGWAYESPDGADHPFGGVGGTAGCAMLDPTCYTRDGSYLRMTYNAGTNRRYIDFPDGSVHTFKPPIGGGPWLLEKISNAFSPNFLEVKYYRPDGAEAGCTEAGCDKITKWVLRDNWGREHIVRFREVTWDLQFSAGAWVPASRMLVESVELSAFDDGTTPGACGASTTPAAGTARYRFTYTDNHILHRPDWHTPGPGPNGCVPNTVSVSMLTTITLPDCTSFDLEYQGGAAGDAGLPAKLTLPTGGAVQWTWQQYMKPRRSADIIQYQPAWGVATRKLLNRDGSTLGTWTYTSTPDCNIDPITGPVNACQEVKATILDPLGNKSEHFFAADPDAPDVEEYGKPFTRKIWDASGTRWLSSRSWSGTSTLLRSTYLAYDDDITAYTAPITNFNARVKSRRIVYWDDDIANNVAVYYLDTDYSDYDGLGHYRKSSTSGTRAGAVTRVTTTNYNPGHGCSPPGSSCSHDTFVPLAAGATWITGTFDSISTTELGFTQKSEYCFDSNGFLKARRALKNLDGTRGDHDLITAFTSDLYGNTTREEYHGGDAATVPVVSGWCGALPATPSYRIDHTYANGGLATSTYVNGSTGQSVGFLSVDNDVDARTGLIEVSRDTAGLATEFVYDIMGRPKFIKPTGAAWTKYTFSPAGTTAAAKVSVTQYPNGQTSGTALTSMSWEFDGIGRPVIERQVMPDNQESRRETTYNALGWTTKISELGSSSTLPVTTSTYDSLGRVLSLTTPDNSIGSFSYTGDRLKKRTSRVSMSPGQPDTAVDVDEEYDAFGRLRSVKEKSGPQGEVVTTAYTYDVGSRLSSVKMSGPGGVSQDRIFDYDGRGFLRWESHAESGMKSYTYDARGQLLTSELGAAKTPFDLKNTYDAAGRLSKIEARDPANVDTWRTIKEFTYAADNVLSPPPADYRKGRLLTATRYNYKPHPGFSSSPENDDVVRVTETYSYRDGAGRKTHRTTVIATSFDGTCCWQEAKSVSQSVSYNDLGQESAVQYPICIDCGTPPGYPTRNLSLAWSQGRPTVISEPYPTPNDLYKWVDGVTYWPNGMRNVLAHKNAMLDTQTVDSSGMPRPGELKSETFSACKAPSIDSQSIGGVRTATGAGVPLFVNVSGTTPMTYQWYDAATNLPIGVTTPTHNAQPATTTSYYVTISNACRQVNSKTMTVKVGDCVEPWIEEATATANGNGSFTLSAVALGNDPLTFTWRRTSDGVIVGTGATVTTPVLSSTTNYTVTVTNNCAGTGATTTVQASVPTAPASPMTIHVYQDGPNQLTIEWGSVAGASSYTLSRRTDTGSWEQFPDLTSTQYPDQNLPADKAYLYSVSALDASSSPIAVSPVKIAATVAFTGVSTGAVIGAAPFEELLRAVNAVRSLAGWQAVTWSSILSTADPPPQQGAIVSSRHLLAIRARLNETLQVLGLPINGYSDPNPQSRLISAQHITEIQDRVREKRDP